MPDRHQRGLSRPFSRLSAVQGPRGQLPPFLIDMANAFYRMDAFDQYLRGQPFILYMDEQPQEDLRSISRCSPPVQLRYPEQDWVLGSSASSHHIAVQDQRLGPEQFETPASSKRGSGSSAYPAVSNDQTMATVSNFGPSTQAR